MSKSGDEFTTKDSGERVKWSTGMQRDTTKGKPLWSLLIPLLIPLKQTMLYRWVMLLTRGAEKYTSRNWEQARTPEELERFKDSAFRHFMQWFAGDEDEDHAAAVFFNVNGAEYVKSRIKQETPAGNPRPPATIGDGRKGPTPMWDVEAAARLIREAAMKDSPYMSPLPENFGQTPTGDKASSTSRPTIPTKPKTSHKLITPNGVTEWNPPGPAKYRSLGEEEKSLLRSNGWCSCGGGPGCRVAEEFDALVDRVVMPLPVAPLLPPEAYDVVIILDDGE